MVLPSPIWIWTDVISRGVTATVARSSIFQTESGSAADRAIGPILLPTIRPHRAGSGNRPSGGDAVAPDRRGIFGQLVDLLFEDLAADNDLTLVACDRAPTRSWWPGLPVGIRQRSFDHFHRARHTDLAVHRFEPMEENGGKRIRLQFLTLLAFLVGVEDETSVIDSSEKDHSRGRPPLGGGCGYCHCLGHGFTRSSRVLEPQGQLSHRVWIDGCFLHGPSLLARGHVTDRARTDPPEPPLGLTGPGTRYLGCVATAISAKASVAWSGTSSMRRNATSSNVSVRGIPPAAPSQN